MASLYFQLFAFKGHIFYFFSQSSGFVCFGFFESHASSFFVLIVQFKLCPTVKVPSKQSKCVPCEKQSVEVQPFPLAGISCGTTLVESVHTVCKVSQRCLFTIKPHREVHRVVVLVSGEPSLWESEEVRADSGVTAGLWADLADQSAGRGVLAQAISPAWLDHPSTTHNFSLLMTSSLQWIGSPRCCRLTPARFSRMFWWMTHSSSTPLKDYSWRFLLSIVDTLD